MLASFVNKYKKSLIELIEKIDVKVLEELINKFDEIERKSANIYILGNGGSAATASHMVNDLGVGLKRRNIKNLKIQSLADNTPVCTAIANDIGYENIFFMQLQEVLQPHDIVVAISCSGNSPNIIKAVKYAKEIGSCVVGLTGFDGGELKNISDISFHIDTPNGSYGLVEDLHMILDHVIYSYYIEQKKD